MPGDVSTLNIETDFTAASSGQIATRLQAFFENNGILSANFAARTSPRSLPESRPRSRTRPARRAPAGGEGSFGRNGKESESMPGAYYAGIDSGSTSTNVVIVDADANIVAAVTGPTGANSAEAARRTFAAALGETGRGTGRRLADEDIAAAVATGYGRASVPFAAKDVTEITCHAKGARRLIPEARTVIDIGGQDSKVICLDDDGVVTEFSMNDKCAAGTGRFLELMADTLGMSMDEMARAGLHPRETIDISSMCAVFAESEVVSLIARGRNAEDIVWGVDLSIAGRVASMAARLGAKPPFAMTGGVAKNAGVVRALGEKLGEGTGARVRVIAPESPEICGALGAALIARER
jgi:predicted CoA-substrate-specific enzyme activase